MRDGQSGVPSLLAVAAAADASGAGQEVSVPENSLFVTTLAPSALTGNSLTFSISGGADAALFLVDETTGDLGFLIPPDHELPGDNDGDNVYAVEVSISDGLATETRVIAVNVLDIGGADFRANDFDNYIIGTSEQDYMEAYAGADTLIGAAGDDRLQGFAGNDSLEGGDGDDGLDGGEGDDLIRGGNGGDSVATGPGQDTVFGGGDGDYIEGGPGNDYLAGEAGVDRIRGQAGNDTLEGGDADD